MSKLTIRAKLILGFTCLIILIGGIAGFSVAVSRGFLGNAVGESMEFLAEEMLGKMNQVLLLRIDTLRAFTRMPVVQQSLERYLERSDSQAQARDGDLVLAVREVFIDLYLEEYGSRTYIDVVISDREGTTVAATADTAPGSVTDTLSWQKAKTDGLYLGSAVYDEEAGMTVLPIAVNITDPNGDFTGVIQTKVTLEEIVRKTIVTTKKKETTQAKLVTSDGRLLYSTRAFRFLEDTLADGIRVKIDGKRGFFTDRDAGKAVLYSYAKSEAVGAQGILPWTLILEHDVDEILRPSFSLTRMILIASLVLIVLCVLVVVYLSRTIIRPVSQLQAAADGMAVGDLDYTVSVRSKDEIGALAVSFQKMNEALKSIAVMAGRIADGDLTEGIDPRSEKDELGSALSTMYENLRRQISEVAEAANVLTSSSSEILASTSQFTANATETASAVNETTATVEEVKQTAHLSNQKAKEVSVNAQQAVEVSRTGKQAVEESNELMNLIRDKMESIAESILHLSEQSQSIGEIMMTVSDLADQSNILAVNAAIEASRAGEQGRGFVVVAQEIKNLADGSREASGQVRKLLADIQKATNSAVLTMEQGSKAVTSGIEQSIEAEKAIRVLSESIDEASQSATQIAASSHQQLVGMDQVALAMESIKAAAGENVTSAGQLESEVQNLNELGQKLKAAVDRYRV